MVQCIRPRANEVVYFLRSRETGLIKIGVTYDLRTRLTTFKGGPKSVELLATIPGLRRQEGQFHALLIEHHVGHEWFEPAERVMAVVNAVKWGVFNPAVLPNVCSPIRSASAVAAWAKRRSAAYRRFDVAGV